MVLPVQKVQTEMDSWFKHRAGELISLVLPRLGMVNRFVIVCYHRDSQKKTCQPAWGNNFLPGTQPQLIPQWPIVFVTAASLGPLTWSLAKLFVKAFHLTIVRRNEPQIQLSHDDRSIQDADFHLRNWGSNEPSDSPVCPIFFVPGSAKSKISSGLTRNPRLQQSSFLFFFLSTQEQ